MNGPAPTPQELMMFVDGELDVARAADVSAHLERDPSARATVEGLALASELCATSALERAAEGGADGIADSVMRRLEGPAAGSGIVAKRRLGPRPVAAFGLALAVAAACILWLRGGGHRTVIPSAGGPAAAVEIDRVDFGARAGTIFFVTTSADKGATAVVWLTDDEPGTTSGEKL